MKTLLLLPLIAAFHTITQAAPEIPPVEVTNVRQVFHNGEHNAFTDLTVFKNAFYLTFRSCPDGHGVSPNASVIVLRSGDGKSWEQVHQFSVDQRDTRDPHFLIFDDRLFVYTGTWFSGKFPMASKDLDLNLHLGFAVVSDDGRKWSEPKMLEGTFGHYIWRAAAFEGKAYLCGRRKKDFNVLPRGEPDAVESLMLESDDGFIWRKRAVFQKTNGDETAFLFRSDGSIIGIGRRGNKNAELLQSDAALSKWKRTDLGRYIGGPLITEWCGRTVVGGRHNTEDGPKTSLCWLVDGKLHEFAQLPSSGDNSYPGFVALSPTKALVSWYSSHEKGTAIYLADLEITEDLSAFSEKDLKVIREADRILSMQRNNGGWSKGSDDHDEIRLASDHSSEDTTIDNGTTHSQIIELAKAFSRTRLPRFLYGSQKGIEYLLRAQYKNGGWPQRYPQRKGYARHITFNDKAIIGVLNLLHSASLKEEPFAWINDDLRTRATDAVTRGIDCILKCQVVSNGILTVWGQQHDEITFLPAPARAFEPVSLCSGESADIVRFLMRLDAPSPEIIRSVDAAVAWFSGPAKLSGIREVKDEEKGKQMVEDADAPPLWSRLYEIGTNRPVFGDRDTKVYYNLADISEERREGYSWYTKSPLDLIEKRYPAWKKGIGITLEGKTPPG